MLKAIIDGGKTSEGYKHIAHIFKMMEMSDVFEYYYAHNSGKDNPYHNNTHTFCVVDLIYQYCISKGYDISESRMAHALITAALFHDFNHSGGKKTDNENINEAIKGLKIVKEKHNYHNINKLRCMLPLHWLLAFDWIKCTQYPYKNLKFDYRRVIREADILSYEHEKWEKYVFEGLCKELGSDYLSNKNELLDKMLKFHKNLVETEIKIPFFKDLVKKHYKSFEEAVNNAKV